MPKKASIAGAVVARFPSPAEQYLGAPLDLNDLLVKRPAATYFVRVKGDSMINAGIRAGDLLVLDRSLTPADGDIIIAALNGEFTVKTYRTGAKTGADVFLQPHERIVKLPVEEYLLRRKLPVGQGYHKMRGKFRWIIRA